MTEAREQTLPRDTLIDDFPVGSVLGIGGFAITRKAHDQDLRLDVALEESFPSGFAQRGDGTTPHPASTRLDDLVELRRDRFLVEARSLACTQQPGVVRDSRCIVADDTADRLLDHGDGRTLAGDTGEGNREVEPFPAEGEDEIATPAASFSRMPRSLERALKTPSR